MVSANLGGVALDGELHLHNHFAMQFHGISYSPDRLDGIVQNDLALVHGKALGGERLGDVGRGDRSEKLIVFTGFARLEMATAASCSAIF